ncbi:MAG: bifunctional demethylmenaquinone methyltransferase/2-methoxy-6-polyprenyl-1,4-benzoquinol methylase UbiE [Planctomycetaceae bacterium]|jgi:demethylmenaquinone methyltransferase/2-methoxy-6-polyprenyl-1,4-benzoquinol methylase|nr:bifunctional demethylmenaquinone methyltransferase/2-methoxy-6-polyprenyl-1,4-benzoquinol methylase UbiE [Planctomycetaceae bacterium]
MSIPNSPDKSPSRIRGLFAAIAPRYDFLNHLLSVGIDKSWRRRSVQTLLSQLRVDGSVLDVCTGTGDFAIELVRSSERDVYGVDFTKEMLQIAEQKRQKLPTEQQDRLKFVEGDALKLPFEDATFALVTVAFGLRNTADTNQALKEMQRVVKPGGIVAVLEFSMPRLPLIKWLYSFYFVRVLPYVGHIISKAPIDSYRHLPESVLDFDNTNQLTERMKTIGLNNPQAKRMTFSIATLCYATRGNL